MGLEAVQVKAAFVLEREHGSEGLTTRDGFGGGLGAKAMATHRELGIPSALPYTSLRNIRLMVSIVPIGIARNHGPLLLEG